MSENEFLTTEVMGWVNIDGLYYTSPDIASATYQCNALQWNPRENIAQAMMLLDQFYDVHIMKEVDAGIKWVWGVELTGITDFHFGSTLPDAIVNAVLKAKGFKDE